MGLIDRFLAGDRRALARLATLIEVGDPVGDAALSRVYPATGKAHIVGVTGPPGAGKSTLVDALIGAVRDSGRRVAVVAVDPSSPISGGAVLGDRVRMGRWHADDGVFVRSMASRGRLGGLAAATAGVVHLLDAAGFPLILVETVGAGQDGVEIASLAQTTVVVQVPGLGDGVQAIKAGLLEIGDILVVNKADEPGAAEQVRLLRDLTTSGADAAGWRVPVLPTVAATGDGVDVLLDHLDAHLALLRAGGGWELRLRSAAEAEVLGRLRAVLERRLAVSPEGVLELSGLLTAVAERRATPGEVVARLVDRLGGG